MGDVTPTTRFKGFYGNIKHSLDTKGRIAVPVKYRDGLGATFMLTKGNDECLVCYSLEEWDAIAERLDRIPVTDREGREFVRHVFGSAQDCEVDKQGRVNINEDLRAYANLTKDVCFVGMRRYFEIWDTDRHKAASGRYDGHADILAEKMHKYLYGEAHGT